MDRFIEGVKCETSSDEIRARIDEVLEAFAGVKCGTSYRWSTVQAQVRSDFSQMKSMIIQCGIPFFEWSIVKKGCAIVIMNIARPLIAVKLLPSLDCDDDMNYKKIFRLIKLKYFYTLISQDNLSVQ